MSAHHPRRQLVHGADDELVGLLKAAHPVEQLAVPNHGPRHLGAREREPCLDLANRFGLQSIGELSLRGAAELIADHHHAVSDTVIAGDDPVPRA